MLLTALLHLVARAYRRHCPSWTPRARPSSPKIPGGALVLGVLFGLLTRCGHSVQSTADAQTDAPHDAAPRDDVAPRDDGSAEGGDDAARDAPSPDVPPLNCDQTRDPCNMVVNFCGDPSVCFFRAKCAADAADAGWIARSICTAQPTPCAEADHCDDTATPPRAASCHCGAGPACSQGAICVSTTPGGLPHCECLPPYPPDF